MRTVSRISRWFAIAGLVAASGLIGWVARTTSANNFPRQPVTFTAPSAQEGKESQIPSPPAAAILELAQAPAEPGTAVPVPIQSDPLSTQQTKSDPGTPDPTPPAIEDSKTVGKKDGSASGADPQPLLAPTLGTSPSPQPSATVSSNPSTAADSEDPEKAVQSFVEQNQKEAETQLKNLRDEQAKLRARLQKVEAGIKRWEVLVEALKMSKNVNSDIPRPRIVPPPAPDTPDALDAIPKARFQPVPR